MIISTNDGLGDVPKGFAYKWLGEKSQATQAEQRRTDRITKIAAIVAAVAAVLGVVITLLAWLYPRH